MSNKKRLSVKTVTILTILVLILGLTIGGTIAWIVDGSNQVVNTFIYGDINITLTETETAMDNDGNSNTNSYELIPDTIVAKDPVVTVLAGSEPNWLFVKLEKTGGTDLFDFDQYLSYKVGIANSDDLTNPVFWTKYTDHGLGDDVEVYYIELNRDFAEDTKYHVLEGDTVTVPAVVTKEMINALSETDPPTYPKLTITAYAVQHEEIADADAAWAVINPAPPAPPIPPTTP